MASPAITSNTNLSSFFDVGVGTRTLPFLMRKHHTAVALDSGCNFSHRVIVCRNSHRSTSVTLNMRSVSIRKGIFTVCHGNGFRLACPSIFGGMRLCALSNHLLGARLLSRDKASLVSTRALPGNICILGFLKRSGQAIGIAG